jgi:protocatechuate 3,4-dioxygenase beta subunit
VQGEQIRKNLKENEKGIDLHLDIQVIDINTCRALKDIAVEIWAANSTGVYTGVIGEGNGNVNDTANINNQALRGVQITGADGSVGFETIFPGYYDGRAVHTHRTSNHLLYSRSRIAN